MKCGFFFRRWSLLSNLNLSSSGTELSNTKIECTFVFSKSVKTVKIQLRFVELEEHAFFPISYSYYPLSLSWSFRKSSSNIHRMLQVLHHSKCYSKDPVFEKLEPSRRKDQDELRRKYFTGKNLKKNKVFWVMQVFWIGM